MSIPAEPSLFKICYRLEWSLSMLGVVVQLTVNFFIFLSENVFCNFLFKPYVCLIRRHNRPDYKELNTHYHQILIISTVFIQL